MERYKYNAFLSYSWDDREIAEKLHDDIENSAKLLRIIPRLRVFKDQKDINQKKGLDEIYRGLDESEHLIILASPNSANSKNCGDEIKYWIEQKRAPKNIKIVLLKGEITKQEKIISGIKNYALVSTSLHPVIQAIVFEFDPISANLSKIENLLIQDRKSGFYRANLLEIVAHCLNTTSRNIEGKESRARWIVFLIGFVVILALLYLTFYAFKQKNEAETRLKDVQLLRMKEFIRKAQIFKEAKTQSGEVKNDLGEIKFNEMSKSALDIYKQYPSDSTFKVEWQKLEALKK